MTTTEIRIQGCQKRIEALEKKITRLTNLNAKKRKSIEDGKEENNKYVNGKYFVESDIEWNEEDIKRAEKDLVKEQAKLSEYKTKRAAEVEKENSIPNVPAVEKFLEAWKEKAHTYYIEEVKSFKEFYKSIKDLGYFDRQKAIKGKYSTEIVMLAECYPAELETKIEKMLNGEVNRKRADLYYRCSQCVGVITDAKGLTIGDNLSLNGTVIGENGKARVETIYAGGYNIQCLHYRVLVNKIK